MTVLCTGSRRSGHSSEQNDIPLGNEILTSFLKSVETCFVYLVQQHLLSCGKSVLVRRLAFLFRVQRDGLNYKWVFVTVHVMKQYSVK